MKKSLFIWSIIVLLAAMPVSQAKTKDSLYVVLKNNIFSLSIPKDLCGTYDVKIKKDTISLFDKNSKNAGFGGFAFGIRAYKNPSDHAVLPGSRKIGELVDKKGDIYDMVLKYPTDVQYDYTKSTQAPISYKKLYDLGDSVEIQGVRKNKYFKNQGMKGETLYKDILNKHLAAINEKWDSEKLEDENMSYMYNVIGQSLQNNTEKVLNKIGYIYYDVNADGIEELLIGEIAEGSWKGVIYDIYTMVNRKPEHVVSGGSRNRYYVCDGSFICNEYSAGAGESGVRVYALIENSTELFPQVCFKYDSYTNPDKPWFLSYGSDESDDKWENVPEKIYEERKQIFEKYEKFDFKSLNSLVIQK